MWKDQYEMFFNGKESIKYSESRLADNFPNNEFGNEEIKRLTSFHDVLLELHRAERFASHAIDYVRALSYVSPLIPLHSPIVKNPWTAFIGKLFKVVNAKCSFQGDKPIAIEQAKRFTIEELYSGSEYPTNLKAVTDGGTIDYKISTGIGRDGQSIGRITVAGDQNSVKRYLEAGTGWEREWIKSSHELQKKGSNFIMTHTTFYQQWTSNAPTQATSSCIYQLMQE